MAADSQPKEATAQQNRDAPPAKRHRLPGVGHLWCRRGSRFDMKFIYREHFLERQYLQHGVTLRPNATIFDVGANIGIFALFAFRECRGDCRLFCFEPIPEIFWFLQRNLQEHGLASSPGVKCFDIGLTHHGGPETAHFTYFPGTPGNSTQHAADKVRQTAALLRLLEGPRSAAQVICRAPKRQRAFYWAGYAAAYPFRPLLRRRLVGLFEGQQVACRLSTLSAVMRAHCVDSIDLLKIDVEGAELDVLRGIDEADWPRIRQVAMEAHAAEGRAERIVALLQRQGFRVETEQPAWARTLELDNLGIYARRE